MAIILRKRKCKNGYSSLYLDIHFKGIRRTEFLGLKTKDKPQTYFEKNEKTEKETLAKKNANQKELELLQLNYSIPAASKKDIDFFTFFKLTLKNIKTLLILGAT